MSRRSTKQRRAALRRRDKQALLRVLHYMVRGGGLSKFYETTVVADVDAFVVESNSLLRRLREIYYQ